MRRKFALVLALLFVCLFAIPAHAAAPIRILMNGAVANFTPAPYTENGATMVSTAGAAELFGLKTTWSEADRKLTLTRGTTVIVLTIDADKALINGKEVALATPARLVNGQTYVPLRFVAENTGNVVSWNEKEQTTVITPTRSLLQAMMAASGKTRDQKLSLNMSASYKVGTGAPGQDFSFDLKLQVESQTYLGQSLTTMVMQSPTGNMTIEQATANGKTYTRVDGKGEWAVAPATGAKLGGMDLIEMSQDLISQASVTVRGAEVIDGVNTLKLDLDLSKTDINGMINQLLGAMMGGLLDEMPNLKLSVEKYSVTYWVNPDTLFVHRGDTEVVMSMTMKDEKETVTMQMNMKGSVKASPTSEPIKWPAGLKF